MTDGIGWVLACLGLGLLLVEARRRFHIAVAIVAVGLVALTCGLAGQGAMLRAGAGLLMASVVVTTGRWRENRSRATLLVALLASVAAALLWPAAVALAALPFASRLPRWAVCALWGLAVLLCVVTWPTLAERLYSSREGLLFWSPALWLGLFGLVALARHGEAGDGTQLGLVGLVWGGQAALGQGHPSDFAVTLPSLALGIGAALAGCARWARRHPGWVVAAGGCILALWNALLMEQYRTRALPADDTIAWPVVAEQSAAMVSDHVGSPVAWPANWIAGVRGDVPLARYDTVVGLSLFGPAGSLDGVMAMGDDRVDPGLLLGGFSKRASCGHETCRALKGRGQLVVPLRAPEDLALILRAEGQGRLAISVNGRTVAEEMLSEGAAELRATIPSEYWRRGPNSLTLEGQPGTELRIVRLTFARLQHR
jgi:hypothetical protein